MDCMGCQPPTCYAGRPAPPASANERPLHLGRSHRLFLYLLLLTTAALVWLTLAIKRHGAIVVRRWGGRIIVLGAFGLFVPFVYTPLAYLLTGGIGNNQLDIALTAGAFGVSAALFGVGLLVLLVEIGMDPTMHLH